MDLNNQFLFLVNNEYAEPELGKFPCQEETKSNPSVMKKRCEFPHSPTTGFWVQVLGFKEEDRVGPSTTRKVFALLIDF